MVPKITTGSDFRGLAAYLFEGKDGERQPRGKWVAGNLFGNAQAIAAQVEPLHYIRPGIKNSVWHCSLNLSPVDGKRSREWWQVVITEFLDELSIDPVKTSWLAVVHEDKAHQHVHIALSRIVGDGRLWSHSNDVRRAITACKKLEIRHRLQKHDRATPTRRKPSSGNRGIVQMERAISGEKIQQAVDGVLNMHPSGIGFADFHKALSDLGVEVHAKHSPDGVLLGLSYKIGTFAWQARKLGSNYSLGILARGLRMSDKICGQEDDKKSPATTFDLDRNEQTSPPHPAGEAVPLGKGDVKGALLKNPRAPAQLGESKVVQSGVPLPVGTVRFPQTTNAAGLARVNSDIASSGSRAARGLGHTVRNLLKVFKVKRVTPASTLRLVDQVQKSAQGKQPAQVQKPAQVKEPAQAERSPQVQQSAQIKQPAQVQQPAQIKQPAQAERSPQVPQPAQVQKAAQVEQRSQEVPMTHPTLNQPRTAENNEDSKITIHGETPANAAGSGGSAPRTVQPHPARVDEVPPDVLSQSGDWWGSADGDEGDDDGERTCDAPRG